MQDRNNGHTSVIFVAEIIFLALGKKYNSNFGRAGSVMMLKHILIHSPTNVMNLRL